MAILGYNTIGGTDGNISANGHYGTRFQASENGSITSMFAYFIWTGANSAVRAAIYNDSAGNPGSLRAESGGAITVSSTDWWEIAISATIVSGDYYWLAVMPDTNNLTQKYDAGTTHQHDQNAGTAYPTWNNPWGSSFPLDRVYSIYAVYTPDSAATLMGQILT